MIATPKPVTAIANVRKSSIVSSREVYREEQAILSALGLPQDVREMKLGQVSYLHSFLSSQVTVALPLPRSTLEIVEERKYEWRSEPSLQPLEPKYALFLDGYIRMNEIYDAFEAHESASRVSNLKSILGRID